MKVLDLFSGIGGFSLGLERAGMETVAFCEIDEGCHKVLKKHWPKTPIIEDVRKVKGKNFNNIDVICGGFPCQDISVAGNKKGFKHDGKRTRSGLWEEFKRVIKEVEPRYAIIENVANLRSLGLNQVIKDLWSIGYACEWHIISARSVGACHLRERVWIIAYPSGQRLQGQGEYTPSRISEEKKEDRETIKSVDGGRPINEFTNSDMPRLWRAFASEEASPRWWTETTSRFGDVFRKIHEIEPTICRSDDGVSDRSHGDTGPQQSVGMGESRIRDLIKIINSGRLFGDGETGDIFSKTEKNGLVKLKGSDLNGYRIYKVYFEKKKYSFRGHQIMMATYGKLEVGFAVDHINRIKTDNRIDNLRLVTAAGNRENQERDHIGVSEKIKQEIYDIYSNTDISQRELAKDVGLSKSRVNQIIKEMNNERARKERVKQLGNSVVPQIPQIIGECLMNYEKQLTLAR